MNNKEKNDPRVIVATYDNIKDFKKGFSEYWDRQNGWLVKKGINTKEEFEKSVKDMISDIEKLFEDGDLIYHRDISKLCGWGPESILIYEGDVLKKEFVIKLSD